MIGHLAAPVDGDDGDVPRRQQMAAVGVHAEREDGLVLQRPDLVGRLGPALVGETLHAAPDRLVVDPAEPPDDG